MSMLSLLAAVAVQTIVTNEVETSWFEDMVPMADGVRLYTYGAVPQHGAKCPIVIMRNPYVKECAIDGPVFAHGQVGNLRRGYAYVFQHVRGAGASEGKRVPYEDERADGLALLDYVRKLPWYNGEIFLSGGSYLSSVHWSYLDTNPADVKGAFLTIQDVNRYNICYRNGFFKSGLHGGWFKYRQALAKSTMPVLLKTGFYDIYTEGICGMWREISPKRRKNCALLIDAYDHGGRLAKDMKGTMGEFLGGARSDEKAEDLDWFDSIRKGKPCNGATADRTRYYALWENAWHEEPALTDGPKRVAFRFGSEMREYAYDPHRAAPNFPGSGGICFGGMRCQPEPNFRDDVLSFVMPPLEERLDVRGRMAATLTVTSDCEDTCFYVRVSVKKPDGKWYLLRDDITSLGFQLGEYVPGTKRRVSFRFADHAFRLEKGDVLRVDVASASSQFAPHTNVKGEQFRIVNPRVAHNRVFAEESELVLHVLMAGEEKR